MLPESFSFSQSTLQDYLTCPRRFDLRHLRRMQWPAAETDSMHEAEARMQRGSDFHHMVQQHLAGVPLEALSAAVAHRPALQAMWQNYLTHRPDELAAPNARTFPEVSLSTVVGGYRLLARYDVLLALPEDPARVIIIDWKTTARRPASAALRHRIQSRVYPYVLARAGASFLGWPLSPEQISLRYWFAHAPAQPEDIPYSDDQFAADGRELEQMVAQLAAQTDFPLTDDDKACRYCVYRSFCERGDVAGPLDEWDDDESLAELDLDWEQISEIAY